jgi:uncharacterized SAM-binding protein YcdF (DUF218 family)
MRYNLWFLFGPISWPIWAWMAAVLGHRFGYARFSHRCWFLGGLWGLAITASPLGHVMIRPLEERYPVPAALGQVDGILMLTGGERLELSTTHKQPVLSEAGERITLSVMLQHKFPTAYLVAIGGVSEPGTLRDTDVAYSVFVGSGIPRDRIAIINGTTDTCSNALATRSILKKGSRWLLVTSAAHMPRAMACFKAAGLFPIPYSVDFRGRKNLWSPLFSPGGSTNLTTFDLASHEWAGLIYYRLAGRIDSLFP